MNYGEAGRILSLPPPAPDEVDRALAAGLRAQYEALNRMPLLACRRAPEWLTYDNDALASRSASEWVKLPRHSALAIQVVAVEVQAAEELNFI